MNDQRCKWIIGWVGVIALTWSLGSGTVAADDVELIVDDDGAECPDAGFTTVQAAVNAAMDGDEIDICPGTYQEQVTISNMSDLVLRAEDDSAPPVIKAPVDAIGPIILVEDSTDIGIRDLIVDGADLFEDGCHGGNDRIAGIRYNDSSGSIRGPMAPTRSR